MKKTTVRNAKNKLFSNILLNLRLPIAILAFNIIFSLLICGIFYLTDADIYSNFPLIQIGLAFSCFITAYFVGFKIRKNGMITGVIYNLPFLLILIISALSVNAFKFDFYMFVTIAVIVFASAIGGIISVNTKRKHRR